MTAAYNAAKLMWLSKLMWDGPPLQHDGFVRSFVRIASLHPQYLYIVLGAHYLYIGIVHITINWYVDICDWLSEVVSYYLFSLSIPTVRRIWLRNHYRKRTVRIPRRTKVW